MLQVVLLSHSQGTIIASDLLCYLWNAVECGEIPEASIESTATSLVVVRAAGVHSVLTPACGSATMEYRIGTGVFTCSIYTCSTVVASSIGVVTGSLIGV